MLAEILKKTQLSHKAFLPKQKNTDVIKNNDEFWRNEYLKHKVYSVDFERVHVELDHVFAFLLKILIERAANLPATDEIIATLQELQLKCKTSPFKKYVGEIKKLLEVIAYYLFKNPNSEKNSSLGLQLLEINVCAESSFLKLQQLVYLLNDPLDIFSWLADFRLQLLYQFCYKQVIHSVHVFNAILNYAQKTGLNVIDQDGNIPLYLASDPYATPLSLVEQREFIDFFCSTYNLEAIIGYCTNRLETELQIRLQEFQEVAEKSTLIFSNQIIPAQIEKKIGMLPINQVHQLLEPGDEEETFYSLKSNDDLKKEIVKYLDTIGIFNKETCTLNLNHESWQFSIIKGDYFGNYGMISKELTQSTQINFLLSAFEEQALYPYVSLEDLQKNKAFLWLGCKAFAYFYQKKANFTDCYLVDVDFKHLGPNFFLSYGLEKANFIYPKFTLAQYENFLQRNQGKIFGTPRFDIENAKAFFQIFKKILELPLENRNLFLESHRTQLANEQLNQEILQKLWNKKTALLDQLKKFEHKHNRLGFYKKMVSDPVILLCTLVAIVAVLAGIAFHPFLPFALGILFADAFLANFSKIISNQLEFNQTNHFKNIQYIKKINDNLSHLENKLIEFKESDFGKKKPAFFSLPVTQMQHKSCKPSPTNLERDFANDLTEIPSWTDIYSTMAMNFA
jgi:hypothetical protein